MKTKLSPLFWIGFVASAILATISLTYRHAVESNNRTIGLCVESQVLKDFAAASRKNPQEYWRSAKEVGMTAVVLNEEYVYEKINSNEINFASPLSLQVKGLELANRVAFAIKARTKQAVKPILTGDSKLQNYLIKFQFMSPQTVRGLSLGLNPTDAEVATSLGIEIVARHSNPPGATIQYVEEILSQSSTLGARYYLPEGEQVLGQRRGISRAARALKDSTFFYSPPEFGNMGGDKKLAVEMKDELVRLHSIQTAEINKMSLDAVIERYVKAARERNMRLLLLRPASNCGDNPASDFLRYIDLISLRIRSSGGIIGAPTPFQNSNVPPYIFPLLGVSVAIVAFSVVQQLTQSFALRTLAASLLVLLGTCANFDFTKPLLAFLAAIVFPIAAFMTLPKDRPRSTLLSFLFISVISLVGGLCVAGLLNNMAYFAHVKQFMGVKLAHLLPVIVVAYLLVTQHFDWKKLLDDTMRWKTALLGILMLGILGLLVVRSGNDAPSSVSSFELLFRSLLDQIMYTRPRSKEFLFGHPALWMGLSLLAMQTKVKPEFQSKVLGWAVLLVILGSIGQASIVNTFCHLHTPLMISMPRVFIGIVFGMFWGWLAMFPVKKYLSRFI